MAEPIRGIPHTIDDDSRMPQFFQGPRFHERAVVTPVCHEICPNHFGLANDLRCTLDRGHAEAHRHHLCEWPGIPALEFTEMKLTLPQMAEGQVGWDVYNEYQVPAGRDPWPLTHRIMWRTLMWVHGHAESLWHWCWRVAQPFKEPALKTETRYLKVHEMRKL